MEHSVVDIPALILSVVIAAAITVALELAHADDNHRRGWIVSGAVAAVLTLLIMADLLRATPRQTPLITAVFGGVLPVLGALGLVRGTRRMRPWIRWPLVFITAFILLYGGLLLGATYGTRLFPV
jgi:hypothetical protein